MTDPIRTPLFPPALRRLAALAGGGRRAASDPRGKAAPAATGEQAAAAYRAAAAAAVAPSPPADPVPAAGFRLVRGPVDLRDGAMVERFLPDILGRALARAWVDPGFRARLSEDPKALLHDHDVHLPPAIWIETETGANGRPMIVVHERADDGRLRRLLYLQLVMVAGK